MSKLTGGRMLGRFLAASRERLRQLASKLNVRHLANVGSATRSAPWREGEPFFDVFRLPPRGVPLSSLKA